MGTSAFGADSIENLLDDTDWTAIRDDLVASALGDECPVDVVLQKLGSQIAGLPAQQLVDECERKIEFILADTGIEQEKIAQDHGQERRCVVLWFGNARLPRIAKPCERDPAATT